MASASPLLVDAVHCLVVGAVVAVPKAGEDIPRVPPRAVGVRPVVSLVHHQVRRVVVVQVLVPPHVSRPRERSAVVRSRLLHRRAMQSVLVTTKVSIIIQIYFMCT